MVTQGLTLDVEPGSRIVDGCQHGCSGLYPCKYGRPGTLSCQHHRRLTLLDTKTAAPDSIRANATAPDRLRTKFAAETRWRFSVGTRPCRPRRPPPARPAGRTCSPLACPLLTLPYPTFTQVTVRCTNRTGAVPLGLRTGRVRCRSAYEADGCGAVPCEAGRERLVFVTGAPV